MSTHRGNHVSRRINLDVLRGFSAVGVLMGHSSTLNATDNLLRFSFNSTVFLFFALSGYLIATPFAEALLGRRGAPDFRAYAMRRLTRVLPAYWAAFLVFALLLAPPDSQALVVSHLLMLQDLVPGHAYALMPVAWTLGVETMFYGLVPLVAWAARRRASPVRAAGLVAWLTAIGLLTLGIRILDKASLPGAGDAGEGWISVLDPSLTTTLCFFVPGIIAGVMESQVRAGAWRMPERVQSVSWPVYLGAAVVCWLGVIVLLSGGSVGILVAQPVILAGSGLALAAGLSAPPWSSWPARGLAAMGTISYGIYLWHDTVIRVLSQQGFLVRAPDLGGWLIACALVLAVSVPLATASWLVIERPLMRRVESWIKWRRSTESLPPHSATTAGLA